MAKEFIVAIEIGSSKITGIAGKNNFDGTITVMAVAQEVATECIRKGVIYNIDKTITALENIREHLEQQLQTKIQKVYVGIGGKSIIGVPNTIRREFPSETKITAEIINEIMDSNRATNYSDRKILDAITLTYNIDGRPQSDPVGVQCTRIEGHFLNIVWRQLYYDNLMKCFHDAKLNIVEEFIAPIALAEEVLAEAERRTGCLLVDLGADTTTVAIYHRNILQHLAVLPLGGANITRDIATLQMEDSEAETLKLKYGSAYIDEADIDIQAQYPLDDDRNVSVARFVELVGARVEEIVRNVWFQVPTEYQDRLRGGLVLTGGGAMMKNIDKVFINVTHAHKVRIATMINPAVDATQPEITAHDGRMNTALSLLAKGNTNCAGESIAPQEAPQHDPRNDTPGYTTPEDDSTTKKDETEGQGKGKKKGWLEIIVGKARQAIDEGLFPDE